MRLGSQTMKNKQDGLAEILLGGIVFVIASGFIVYAIFLSNIDKNLSKNNFVLYGSFQSVDGITVGSDILLAGVKVGIISDIQLDKDSFQAKATFSLFEDYKLPEDTEAVINADGLLGAKYVSLNVGGSEIALADGDEILYTQSALSIINLLNKFTAQ